MDSGSALNPLLRFPPTHVTGWTDDVSTYPHNSVERGVLPRSTHCRVWVTTSVTLGQPTRIPLPAMELPPEFQMHFETEEQCFDYLFRLRYPDPKCPHCERSGAKAFHRRRRKRCFTCNCGRTNIYPQAGSVFEYSPLPLLKWFYAVFLLNRVGEQLSLRDLQAEFDVTHTTAWR